MRFSRATTYAVQALAYMAAHQDGQPMTSHATARACGIPERFLLKVLRLLVAARLLTSLRGPNGGYQVVRPAKGITLLEVLEAVEGRLRGGTPMAGLKGPDGLDGHLQEIGARAAEMVRGKLQRVRLSDLPGKR